MKSAIDGKNDPTSKQRKNTELPDFFMKYDDASFALEHLMRRDPLNPERVTHFCAVPLADVPSLEQSPDTKEGDMFWKLKDMTCDQLSKLLTQLGAQRHGMKKSEMIVAIDAIDKRCVNWTAIKKQKDMSKVELIMHGNKIVFRVINVLFNVAFFGKFTSLNDNYDRQTHETYTTDMFFIEVSEAVNDNGSPIHASLLPCEDDKYKVQYDFYISEDRIPTEELPRGIMTNAADSKLCKQIYNDLVLIRKKMIGFMTQSGTHDGDVNPFEYVNQATKKAKVGFAYCPMAVYYFYMNCKFRPEVCESQRVSMNPILKDPKQSLQVSQKKKVITPNDNEYMKSFCSKMSDQLEEGHKVKKDELTERRQSRISNEINS